MDELGLEPRHLDVMQRPVWPEEGGFTGSGSELWDGGILENHIEATLAKQGSITGTWVQINVLILADHLTTQSFNFLISDMETNDTSLKGL